MIRIECPSCRAKYTVEAHTVGRTARCACGDRFRIEEPASLQPAGEPAAPPQGQRVLGKCQYILNSDCFENGNCQSMVFTL